MMKSTLLAVAGVGIWSLCELFIFTLFYIVHGPDPRTWHSDVKAGFIALELIFLFVAMVIFLNQVLNYAINAALKEKEWRELKGLG